MADFYKTDPVVQAQVIELVARERAKALSTREWRHRIAGLGYSISATDAGHFIEKLGSGARVCPLPADLCA